MSSVCSSDTVLDIKVKRTRSGRAVIPPLAGWTGERIVSSLDAPLQYVTPSLDARAQYLLSSSMLERLKEQKLIREPFQVKEKIFPVAPVSDHSGRSVSQQKRKSLGTGRRKFVAHKTEKAGLTRTGILKKKKAVYRMHTRCNEDDKFGDRKSGASEGVVLQLERYSEVESESSESRSSSPSLEFRPSHSKKQSSCKADIRRKEIDTYLLKEEQTRSKNQVEQANASKDLRANHRADHSMRSGKSNNMLIITELQKDETDDFRISKKDMENYYFSDEDSDIVYTNY